MVKAIAEFSNAAELKMSGKVGFLFPGQGAQFPGMGKDLFDQYDVAKSVYEQADQILGYSISEICFNGPEEKLTKTLYAQPAIYVSSCAALSVLRKVFPDIKPSFAAGLSLGEFTALFAVGSISFEQGLKLVAARARAMEEAAKKTSGTMASILGLGQEDCAKTAQEAGCELANLNSPDQFVLSGSVETIEKACKIAEEKGAKRAIKLKVGGAFHSALMKAAEDSLEKALVEVSVAAPQGTFIPNVTGRAETDPASIKALLAKQLTSPVQWIETMNRASEHQIDFFLEVGPGKVLKGLARKCQPALEVLPFGSNSDVQKLEQRIKAANEAKGA